MATSWPLHLWLVTVCLVLTILGYISVDRHNTAQISQRTERLLSEAVELVQSRFQLYEHGLAGARGAVLVAGAKKQIRSEFETYIDSRDLTEEFPGARGFGYIRLVPEAQEGKFLELARLDGAPDFSIKMLNPHDQSRFIIQYIYPQEPNKQAIGLDIGSESSRRSAALAAALSNQAKLTAPITLVQAEGAARRGFLILLPIYDPSLSKDTSEERLDALLGWSYAPLVVDEVLFDFGSITREISLSIRDRVEDIPFFDTLPKNVRPLVIGANYTNELRFMGREWVVEAKPLADMEAVLGLRSPLWIVVIGAVFYGIALVLLRRFFRKDKELIDSLEDTTQINLLTFFSSKLFLRVVQVNLIAIPLLVSLGGFIYLEQEFSIVEKNLVNDTLFVNAAVKKQHERYTEDIVFLSVSPPVKGLVQADSFGFEYQQTVDELKLRLAEIFSAYMRSSKDIYQVRLIQANAVGQEIVRVMRSADTVYVASEEQLQQKIESLYFEKALALDQGKVYISDIEPNFEDGEIETPLRPTIRYATKISHADGSAFGILVINVEAKLLLNEIASLTAKDETIYLTNASGEFISGGDNTPLFGSLFGMPYGWDNAFSRQTLPFGAAKTTLSAWSHEDRNLVAAIVENRPDRFISDGTLVMAATYPVSAIVSTVASTIGKVIGFLAIIGVLSVIVFYFVWVNIERSRIASRLRQEFDARRVKDKMFESITELAPEAMVITDSEGVIVLVNSQSERLFGYIREEMLGKRISMLVPSEISDKHDQYVENYLLKPSPRAMGEGRELFGRRFNGTQFPAEVSLAPIDVEGNTFVAASVRNIYERKHIEQTLNAAIEVAERASQAKGSFLANMSHEIRTPLNAVIGLTYLLKDEDLSVKQQTIVNKIQLAGRSLLGIVNDVLDLAKIEANELAVNEELFNLIEMCNELESVFASQAEAKGLEFRLMVQPKTPRWVYTDRKLLQQIVTNLLGNAIKFTREGYVSLSVYPVESGAWLGESKQRVCISVDDTGVGISKEAREKIFQPFTQAEDSTNRNFGGTGLGLSIVSTLTSALGGEISLESQSGQGSRFSVVIPLTLADADDQALYSYAANVLDVLIAEDDPDDRARIERASLALGWRTSSVADGQELIDAIQRCLDDERRLPDVLLIDLEMPNKGGMSALNEISAMLGKEMPAVLVISAHDLVRAQVADGNHLVDSFLQKAVNASILFDKVNEAVVKHTGNTERVIESTKVEAIKAAWLAGVKVLAVDDSSINLEVLTSILERNGAIVTAVDSGFQALEYISRNPDEFDAVLMDIQMPGMDGIETVKRIRSDLNLSKLPVIALTAGALDDERKRVLAAGMNDFLTKPIEPSRLIQTLRKIITHYRGHSISIQAQRAEAQDDKQLAWPVIKGLDCNINFFDGDERLFSVALETLLSEYKELEETKPRDRYDLNDEAARLFLAGRLHKLRGVAGIVGAQQIQEMSAQAEQGLRNNTKDVESALLDLAKALTDLRRNSAAYLEKSALERVRQVQPDLSHLAVIGEAELANLIQALENNDLSAFDILEAQTDGVRALIGNSGFDQLYDSVLRLDYRKAVELLRNRDT